MISQYTSKSIEKIMQVEKIMRLDKQNVLNIDNGKQVKYISENCTNSNIFEHKRVYKEQMFNFQ